MTTLFKFYSCNPGKIFFIFSVIIFIRIKTGLERLIVKAMTWTYVVWFIKESFKWQNDCMQESECQPFISILHIDINQGHQIKFVIPWNENTGTVLPSMALRTVAFMGCFSMWNDSLLLFQNLLHRFSSRAIFALAFLQLHWIFGLLSVSGFHMFILQPYIH